MCFPGTCSENSLVPKRGPESIFEYFQECIELIWVHIQYFQEHNELIWVDIHHLQEHNELTWADFQYFQVHNELIWTENPQYFKVPSDQGDSPFNISMLAGHSKGQSSSISRFPGVRNQLMFNILRVPGVPNPSISMTASLTDCAVCTKRFPTVP